MQYTLSFLTAPQAQEEGGELPVILWFICSTWPDDVSGNIQDAHPPKEACMQAHRFSDRSVGTHIHCVRVGMPVCLLVPDDLINGHHGTHCPLVCPFRSCQIIWSTITAPIARLPVRFTLVRQLINGHNGTYYIAWHSSRSRLATRILSSRVIMNSLLRSGVTYNRRYWRRSRHGTV